MSINKNNYETYLIDYLDGKLTPVQVSEVLLFLEQYPEIKSEFEGLGLVKDLEQTSVSFDASFLKKPTYPEVKNEYEQLLVAELEGDLSKAEKTDLTMAKQLYPELNRDAALFAKTKVVPENIPFPNKAELKKPVIIPIYQQTWMRIAAVLLLVGFAGVVWINFNSVEMAGEKMALIKANANESKAPQSSDNAIIEKNGSSVSKMKAQKEKEPGKHVQSTTASDEAKVIQHHAAPLLISLLTPAIDQPSVKLNAEGLSLTNQYLKYKAPVKEEEYSDLRQLAVQQIGKQKEQLLGKDEEGKTLTLLQAINKATGDNIKVDTNGNGKVTRFEIAGLGFEWSHSK